MFTHVVKEKHIQDYNTPPSYKDGVEGEIDLPEKVSKNDKIFKPLPNINYFKKFKIINDTTSWNNRADLAPEFLHTLVNKK